LEDALAILLINQAERVHLSRHTHAPQFDALFAFHLDETNVWSDLARAVLYNIKCMNADALIVPCGESVDDGALE
jgi:hypothetical protein